MLVFESRHTGDSVAIWVTGGISGYQIVRQALTLDGEIETTWKLGRMQSRQLRATLGARVLDDSLKPTATSAPAYDHLLSTALSSLTPPAQPFTWHTRDAD
jgi:hypothetical protein